MFVIKQGKATWEPKVDPEVLFCEKATFDLSSVSPLIIDVVHGPGAEP